MQQTDIIQLSIKLPFSHWQFGQQKNKKSTKWCKLSGSSFEPDLCQVMRTRWRIYFSDLWITSVQRFCRSQKMTMGRPQIYSGFTEAKRRHLPSVFCGFTEVWLNSDDRNRSSTLLFSMISADKKGREEGEAPACDAAAASLPGLFACPSRGCTSQQSSH